MTGPPICAMRMITLPDKFGPVSNIEFDAICFMYRSDLYISLADVLEGHLFKSRTTFS